MNSTTVLAVLVGLLGAPEPGAASLPDGEALLAEAARAYRSAPAFTDEITVRISGPYGSHMVRVAMASAGDDLRVEAQGHVLTAVGGRLYVYRPATSWKYYAEPVKDDVARTIEGINLVSAPALGLVYGKGLEDFVRWFGVPNIDSAGVVGARSVDREGRALHEVELTALTRQPRDEVAQLGLTARLDPVTKFIVDADLSLGDVRAAFSFSPRRLEKLPEPIAFETSGKRPVTSLQGLALAEGDPAPDFTLETIDGARVRLADERGRLVVLDFWATTCGPCKVALPNLERFHAWAQGEGLPVVVYAVDIREKREIVSRYWRSKGFTMGALLDADGAVAGAYEVNPIPHTVVIGPDGTILDVEIGFNPRLTSSLQELTRRALKIEG